MARTSERPAIQLTEEQKHELEKISRSRTLPAREVERASIILRYAARESITSIRKNLGVSRPTIYKWKGIDEINATPIVHRWKKFADVSVSLL
jgi:DNA invertase Pin-like site-specific DNA recombinase